MAEAGDTAAEAAANRDLWTRANPACWVPEAAGELAAAGMTGITCLIHQSLIPG